MNIKTRVKDLEEAKRAKQPGVIIVDWGNPDAVTINGQEIGREEAERLYPSADRIKVEYIETPYPDS